MGVYNVSVERATFWVTVPAKDEDEAIERVQELLEKGMCTGEEDEADINNGYKVGNEVFDITPEPEEEDN